MRQLAQDKDPAEAWRIVKRILPLVPDESLGYLAAGPIEDLINFHGADFIEDIEKLASDDDRFRLALTYIRSARGSLKESETGFAARRDNDECD